LLPEALAADPRIVELRGSFPFDAIGPDGRYLFLIERIGEAGSDHYQVRAWDSAVGRLLDAPIVDKREIGELMEGAPVARAMSADGQWAHTLYLKEDGTAFVHQLDTRNGLALCVDLPEKVR